MKIKIKITELCSYLHGSYHEKVEIENTSRLRPSAIRIRQIALAKLEQQGEQTQSPACRLKENTEKGFIMKKSCARFILIAAIVCLLSATAFAATGGLEFFKSIFGSSVETLENEIWSPMISEADESYKITVESMLSDGYKTNIVVSLEDLKGNKIDVSSSEVSTLFTPKLKDNPESFSYSCTELSKFAQKTKKYYYIEVSSLKSYKDSDLTLSLSETIAPLKVDVIVNGLKAAKEIKIDPPNGDDQNYRPETVQVSPLGVLVIGSEKQAKGGLPTSEIRLLMKDGSFEELELLFDDVDGTVMGGGAVISGWGQKQPLVVQTMGQRNPDGKVVTTGHFSRILNLNEVKAISVDGTEYPFN